MANISRAVIRYLSLVCATAFLANAISRSSVRLPNLRARAIRNSRFKIELLIRVRLSILDITAEPMQNAQRPARSEQFREMTRTLAPQGRYFSRSLRAALPKIKFLDGPSPSPRSLAACITLISIRRVVRVSPFN